MKRIFFICSLCFTIVASVILYAVYSSLFKSNVREGTTYLYVPTSATFDQLMDSVKVSDRFISVRSFEKAAEIEKLSSNIKPGRYKIVGGMINREIIRAIKFGWQSPVRLTIAGNIRTKEKLASILSKKIESDSTLILALLNDNKLADSLGFNAQTFIAMFLPNTYEIYWTTTPRTLFMKLRKEYDKFWNSERLGKAKEIGLSPLEAITLASIVSEESNVKKEQSTIAGVYMNRLHKKVPLQADPTIKYALNDPAIKRILFKHLEVKSAYNTYKNLGLPPGPIVIPGLYTVDAVLNYERHKYMYFCAKPSLDGSHVFSVTLDEHHKNARAYQRAISRL